MNEWPYRNLSFLNHKVTLVHKDGTVQPWEGACLYRWQYENWPLKEVRYLVESYKLLGDIATWYLSQLEKWGWGSYKVGEWWITSNDEVNITKWYSIFAMLRYLWESPNKLYFFHKMAHEEPTYDTWGIFNILHTRWYEGHSLYAWTNHEIRTEPSILIKAYLQEVTGFDWTKRLSTEWVFRGCSTVKWCDTQWDINKWKDFYARYMSLPLYPEDE